MKWGYPNRHYRFRRFGAEKLGVSIIGIDDASRIQGGCHQVIIPLHVEARKWVAEGVGLDVRRDQDPIGGSWSMRIPLHQSLQREPLPIVELEGTVGCCSGRDFHETLASP